MIAIGVLIVLTFLPFMQGVWWRGVPDWWNMPEWLEATLRTGWILALVAGLIWLTVFIARRVPRTRLRPAAHLAAGTGRSCRPGGGCRRRVVTSATSPDAAYQRCTVPTTPVADAARRPRTLLPFAAPATGLRDTWYGTPAAAHAGYTGTRAFGCRTRGAAPPA